jgi:hypothetical protein
MGKNLNIFQNTMKEFPFKHNTTMYPQAGIVNDDMNQIDIQGRKDHLPPQMKSDALAISNLPNASSTPGGSS